MRSEIIKCDTCTKEHDAQYVLPNEWVEIRKRDGFGNDESMHFCSKTCLIKWASIGIATCDVEIMVDAIRTQGHTAKQEREQKYGKPNQRDKQKDTGYTEQQIIELLADKIHRYWSRCMQHIFDVSKTNEDGSFTIPHEFVDAWIRLVSIDHKDLLEIEKKHNRDEVSRMMPIINSYKEQAQ